MCRDGAEARAAGEMHGAGGDVFSQPTTPQDRPADVKGGRQTRGDEHGHAHGETSADTDAQCATIWCTYGFTELVKLSASAGEWGIGSLYAFH